MKITQIIDATPGWRAVFAGGPPAAQKIEDGQPPQMLQPQPIFRPIACWALIDDGRVLPLVSNYEAPTLWIATEAPDTYLGISPPGDPGVYWTAAAVTRWKQITKP